MLRCEHCSFRLPVGHDISIKSRRDTPMIIPFSLGIALLLSRMKAFDWPSPRCCPNCQDFRIWRPGFVYRLFDVSSKPVPMKRYRCVDCGCIIQLRPEGFFPQFQASRDTIRKSILSMVQFGRPLAGISRQRQSHWLNALKRRVAAMFRIGADLIDSFEKLIKNSIVPVARLP